MEAPEVRRAVEAAVVTASSLGLPVDDAVVVHNSNRIAVHLAPCDVLARVCPSVHRAGAQFEVEVGRRLAEANGPVAEPDSRVEPRAYIRDLFAVTLWTYYEPLTSEIAPRDYAAALMRLHASLRQIDLGTPHFTDRVATALKDVGDAEQTPALPSADRELLSNTLSKLSAAICRRGASEQLLHGEPHPGNVLSTRRGPLFIDLETSCRGPVEFDLAHAPDEVAEHYPGADPELVHQCRILMWALITTWRWERDDQLPNGQHWRIEGLNEIRAALGRYRLDWA